MPVSRPTVVTEPLTAQDCSMLESSYISRDIAAAAGLFRVASLEGRALVGRKDKGDYGGIVFPYRWPENSYV
jgi:hypothetical protein